MSVIAQPAQAYIRRETGVAIIINSVLSLLFYLAAFGRTNPVPVWGIGNWVFDFLPQFFMIAFMSTLVSGFLAGKHKAAGKVEALDHRSALPRNLFGRALLLAVCSAALGMGAVAAIVWVVGVPSLSSLAAILLKIGGGAMLAALVTPPGLRAALARPAAG